MSSSNVRPSRRRPAVADEPNSSPRWPVGVLGARLNAWEEVLGALLGARDIERLAHVANTNRTVAEP